MTGAKDPGIVQATWDAYADVLADGDLSVRVFVLWSALDGTIEEVRAYAEGLAAFTRPYESTGDDRLIAGGVKLYGDGSGGARTAWLYDDWNREFTGTDTGNRGYPTMDPDELRQRFRAYHDAGLHVGIHSIGDRAIDWTVESIQEALAATPTKGLRHGIIHSNIPTDRALDAMAELQRDWQAGYPEPSPTFTWWIGDTYAGNFGPERALRLNPFRSYRERGMIWASGSDFFVTPYPARYGVWASVARKPLLGVYGDAPYGTEQSVDVETALRSFTVWAAHQMFLEDKVGTIEPVRALRLLRVFPRVRVRPLHGGRDANRQGPGLRARRGHGLPVRDAGPGVHRRDGHLPLRVPGAAREVRFGVPQPVVVGRHAHDRRLRRRLSDHARRQNLDVRGAAAGDGHRGRAAGLIATGLSRAIEEERAAKSRSEEGGGGSSGPK